MTWDPAALAAHLAWPGMLALAWLLGEFGHRVTLLPRISIYGLVGFGLGSTQLGLLPPSAPDSVAQLADVAFGLILFEFGYGINLRWYRTNAWIGASAVLASLATFAAVYAVSIGFGMPVLAALLMASLAMSTSPAAIMRVVNEERSTGQVTERVMHLTAVNCLLSVFVFKVVVGFWTVQTAGSLWQAFSDSLLLLAASVAIGIVFGAGVPALLRRIGHLTRDATLGFAIGVILLVAIAHACKLSPVLAALTFGLVARHRRVVMNQTQRNFGALGDLLAVLLFVFIGTTIAWQRVWTGLALALAVIGVRLAVQVLIVGALARVSGTTWRKGVLTGLALAPMSVFVILLLEQTRFLGIDLIDQLAPLAAATLLLEVAGPWLTQRALVLAGEAADKDGR